MFTTCRMKIQSQPQHPEDEKALSNIRVVLASPLYGGNVGAVCRAMANAGVHSLVLVDPRPMDQKEIRMMACNAWEIYEHRRELPTLAEAVADCGLIVGTSARQGLYRAHSKTPREWAPKLLDAARLAPVALVFGREDWGLSNEELTLCTQVIQIPSHPAYTSLNLSQAVMVCLYELFVASEVFEPSQEKSPEAPSALRERMFKMWEEALFAIGFMEQDKAMHMMLGIRRVFSRGLLTIDDVKILMGMARQTLWKARNPGKTPFKSLSPAKRSAVEKSGKKRQVPHPPLQP